MKSNSFYKNSFILTSSNIATGVLGFIFSIYLSKVLGPEGVGLYGLVMPIYNLFIGLMTAGIIAAISKISALYSSKNDYGNLIKTLKTVAFFNLIWAAIISIVVFFFAPYIGAYGVNDSRTINAIRVTCPAMFFIAVSNILKGYFFGVSKISIPSFIDILEKALRIFILASLIYFLKAKSLSALVTVAYFSLCIGELQSLILLFIYYKRTIRNVPKVYTKTERRPQLLFDVLIISLPLALNSFLTSIFSTTSTLIVPRRLMASGLTYSEALAMIGKFNGMAFVIVTFPIIVISSINSLLIPDLSQTMGSKDYFNASNRIKQVIKIAFLLGLCTFILCQLIPDSLGYMFFTRNDLGSYIKAASFATPILFPAISMFGILNGLGKQGIIVRNSLIIEIVEISSLFILTSIPSINIYGIAITAVITSAIGLTINLREVNKVISLEFSYINILIYIFIGILAYLSIGLLLNLFSADTIFIKNLIVMALIGALFIFLLFASRRLGED